MIIVSIIVYLYSHTAKYKGTELLPPFWVLIYFQYKFFIISSLFPEFIVDNFAVNIRLYKYGYAQVKLMKMGCNNKEILLKINM